MCYTYDADGNLATKVAAAGASSNIQTTFTYDALDRALTKTYTDGTPTVTYCYDGPLRRVSDPTGNRPSHVGELERD